MDQFIDHTLVNDAKKIISAHSDEDFSKEIIQLDAAESPDTVIHFIDGGNAEITSSARFCIEFIRTASTSWKAKKRISSHISEFFLILQQKKESIEAKVYSIKNNHPFPKDLFSIDPTNPGLKEGNIEASLIKIASYLRRIAEIHTAQEIAKKHEENSIIVIDGDLDSRTPQEENEIKSLFAKCRNKNIPIIGLSKTTQLSNHKYYLYLKQKLSFYAKDEESKTFFAKLHPLSRHLFRLDITKYSNPKRIFETLMPQCSDPAFIGYPYGLIETDRLARISNEEANYLRMKLRVLLGKDEESLQFHLNSMNAHEILDKMRY